jgi:mRNA-degrading endonuclease RelE of RelBE toxin-antitoxin system
MFNINLSKRFVKDLKNLKKKFDKIENDLDTLFSALSKDNIIGDRVQNFKSFEIYKARLRNSSSGKSKSGGFRVIYYLKRNNSEILALTIYSKSQKTDISKKEILNILKSEI